jgi:hypothetical protein
VLGVGAEGFSEPVPRLTSWWQRLLASPKTSLLYAYYLLGIVVLGLLAYVTGLEFHKRHFHHLRAAGALIVLMVALFVVADLFFFTEPVIAALLQ